MTPHEFTYWAIDEQSTERLGAALARVLPVGSIVALQGTLGAGKTRLVQAVAAACADDHERVTSPTFTLCHEYPGDPSIVHFDWYRLQDEDELLELGWDEYCAMPRLIFVEWADRFPSALPREHWQIAIEVFDTTQRRFTITANGATLAPFFVELKQVLSAPI